MRLGKKLLKKAAYVMENGTPEQQQLVQTCLTNDDLFGLEWSLKNMENDS